MRAKARAHTNIALIKYWGKRDEKLFLPTNNSLSMTLDQFYTETVVEFNPDLKQDKFILDGIEMNPEETAKVSRFMDKIRRYTGQSHYALIDSINHVPTAAGFASSASGYAALAAAAMKASGVSFSENELSIMARQGSGSASRSIYGGFVEWQKGEKEDGSDCYAVPILEQGAWDLRVLSVEVTHEVKKVLSREGMKRTVETSPFFAGWLEAVAEDLVEAKAAIAKRDFIHLGETLERNALRMHATTLGANPPFMYWQSSTVKVMEAVQALRENGIHAYFTIDAGPNVKVVCQPEDEEQILDALSELDVVQNIYRCKVGPGVSYLEG
ncbi:diphosphomevalonate decarboxylase [Amphibacillus xylanus]|uniref:diphosphomevalonate decarboxylase n=1 Tax=Amphibacillus xylanus (strain ATCC 51415 / DSM 6626 / JCM 7361 / LMG 17667 / NBRC 15112 / Ep01) TaxID=698758 RepID=K0IVG8_AMPXN|nr:diphosphomevalonate decarboxylase [Amphibacillus xylanus]BAM46415.1 diphosphomevalonate decarboxylase [Amphibacillus xylanus NBRC 15112]